MLKNLLFTSLLLLQTACTSVIWNGGIYHSDRAIDTQTTTQSLQSDAITHVSLVSQAPNEPLSGSLMLHGTHYWYAIRADVAPQIAPILQTRLPQRYQITAPYSGTPLSELPIVLHNKGQFSSDFCLDYHLRQSDANSINTLKAMGFQVQYAANHYRKCFALVGTAYTKPETATAKRALARPIPVALSQKNQRTIVQTKKLARNILLTPLALAVDTISGMAMLPILLINDML